MPKKPNLKQVSPVIHAALSRLRSMIRWYVLLDGFAIAVIWLVLTFWIFVTVDYVPVLFGMHELPWSVRLALLVFITAVLGWVLFQWVVRRIATRLSDTSMALLIERAYPRFNDSLITSVQSAAEGSHQTQEMLDRTRQQAEQHLASVKMDSILNRGSLRIKIVGALVLLASGGLFALAKTEAFQIAAQRLYLLDDEVWPRQCHIEIMGAKIKRENAIDGISEISQLTAVSKNQIKIARGSTIVLLVRADTRTDGNESRRLPRSCIMRYRFESGERGRQAFKRIGVPRNGCQLYSLDGPPLDAVLSDFSFVVRGGDHQIGPVMIKTVPPPIVIETVLKCRFPDYMVDPQSMRWTERNIAYTGATRLPRGTQIQIQCRSNKQLSKVYVAGPDDQIRTSIVPSGDRFQCEIDGLNKSEQFHFYLCDQDGVVAEQPHGVLIESIEDQPPIVQSELTGIGSAVTPDVLIPISGRITDDYGVAKTWVEVETNVTENLIEPAITSADGMLHSEIDFRAKRQLADGSFSLDYGPENKIALTVKARDYCDLGEYPNEGVGDRFEMDVVSPGQLLKILERLEVGQRRRLEQILLEMNDARGYLGRTGSGHSSDAAGYEPGDPAIAEGDTVAPEQQINREELRLLFVQRAMLQVEKSTQEIIGVAEVFENIRLQMINNRVDTEDRKKRLSELIVAPLKRIVSISIVDLGDSIGNLQRLLEEIERNTGDQPASDKADQLSRSAIEKADKVLTELDQVLGNLLKFETQNELLDIVRQMIRQQEQLMESTRKERQRQAFQGLLD